MYNFGKYTTSLVVAILSYKTNQSFHYFGYWLAAAILSTLYSLYWDIFMDWGFYSYYQNKDKLETQPNVKINYILGSVIDTILRFVWVMTISFNIIASLPAHTHQIIVFFLSLLELIRRCIWNHYRVKYEYSITVDEIKKGNNNPNEKQSDDPQAANNSVKIELSQNS